MTQDTTKKSAPENEETILGTFNEKQRLVLYYLLSKAVEDEETVRDVLDTLNEKQRFVNKAAKGEETVQDVLDTLNDKQRLVLNYLVNKAAKDAKKGKTSKSKNNNTEPGEETR